MEAVAISKFKAECLAILERVQRTGRPVLVTRFGKPVAEVVAPSRLEAPPSWLGRWATKGRIVGDIVEPVGDESDWEAAGTPPP